MILVKEIVISDVNNIFNNFKDNTASGVGSDR